MGTRRYSLLTGRWNRNGSSRSKSEKEVRARCALSAWSIGASDSGKFCQNEPPRSRSASDSHHFERAYLSFIRVAKVINDLPHLYTIVYMPVKNTSKNTQPAWNTCGGHVSLCNLESVITCRALYTLASYSRRVVGIKMPETIIDDTKWNGVLKI